MENRLRFAVAIFSVSEVPKRGRSKRGRTQRSAREGKRKRAKKHKRAQQGSKERKRALSRTNCKQP